MATVMTIIFRCSDIYNDVELRAPKASMKLFCSIKRYCKCGSYFLAAVSLLAWYLDLLMGFLVEFGRLLSPMRQGTFLRMSLRAFRRWPGPLPGTRSKSRKTHIEALFCQNIPCLCQGRSTFCSQDKILLSRSNENTHRRTCFSDPLVGYSTSTDPE